MYTLSNMYTLHLFKLKIKNIYFNLILSGLGYLFFFKKKKDILFKKQKNVPLAILIELRFVGFL